MNEIRIEESLPKNKLSVLGYPELLKGANVISYGYVTDDNLILPFVYKKSSRFWKRIELPCNIIGESVGDDKQVFINKAINLLCKQYNVDVINTLNTNPMNVYPEGAYYCKFGSYILDLSQSEDELFAGLHSKHRNVIRKAEKDGLCVESGPQYWEDCYLLIKGTYERQGKYFGSKSSYSDLLKLKDNVDFWIVKSQDSIQGCAILFWDSYSSYYMHGGSAEHTHSGAMNYLHWKAILKMKERGVRYYDFVGARLNPDEGSKLEGIQRFKSRFGGPMHVGYMWRYTNHPLKMRLYNIIYKLYFKWIKGDHTIKDIITEEREKGNF